MRKSLLALFIVSFIALSALQYYWLAHFCKALAAINRTVRLRLKRNASLAATGSTGCGKELTRTASSVLACVAAALAALRLVLETTLCVEFLLAGSEYKFLTTFLAY